MRRVLLTLAACVLCHGAFADMLGPSPAFMKLATSPSAVIAPSYSGPGNVVSGAFYWVGLRAYTSAIAAAGTQKIVNVRRTSDSHTCDVLVASNGGLANTANCSTGGDNGQTAPSFCTSTTCFAVTLYDQSGNGLDFTQATTANQPQILFTGCTSGSLPCLSFTSSQSLIAANQAGVTYPGSVELVSNRTGDFSSFDNAFFNNIATLTYWNTANSIKFRLATGDVNMAATDNAWHCIQGVGSATVAATSLDGVYNLVGNGGTSGPTVTPDIGNFTGMIVEAGEWNTTAFTSANTTSMNSNIHTYWGF